MVNIEKQPEDVVKLFNRWYVLIQQRIAKVDFEECDMRKAFELSGQGSLQKQNYGKLIWTFGQYDTTHFTTIYYNKKVKDMENVFKESFKIDKKKRNVKKIIIKTIK